MTPLLFVVFAVGSDGGVSRLSDPVTRKNWEQHPSVAASRAVVTEVSDALLTKALTVRAFVDCTEEFSTFKVAADSRGLIRQLIREFGGGDSSHHAESWYDSAGRARFIFVRVGAVPSAWVEARFWLDEQGKVVWTTRQAGGEGPTGYARDVAEYLVKDPANFVAQRAACDAG